MAYSINKVTLLGNLGQDPEIRTTPNGAQVANFSVACTERWTDQSGQKQERTEWVRCVAWRKLAEIIGQYVKKGDKIYVEGKLQTRSWDDANGGGKKYATEVVVDEIVLLGNGGGNGGGQRQGGSKPAGRSASNGGDTGFDDFGPGAGVSAAPADDNDLPF